MGPRPCLLRWVHRALLALALTTGHFARADAVVDLSASLLHDSSVRVRIVSAVSLGKLRDRRGIPALDQALRDPDPTVRGVSAMALGEIGDPSAVPVVRPLLRDASDFVRDQARKSLALLTPMPTSSGGTYVALKGVGNRTPLGGKLYADKLRDFVVAELTHTPNVTLTPGRARDAYTLEASITDLHREMAGDMVEVSCTVSLVVGSYPDGAIVMMTTGDATVQVPRHAFHPAQEPGMQLDAMESAVKGANQNFAVFLASRH